MQGEVWMEEGRRLVERCVEERVRGGWWCVHGKNASLYVCI